MLDHGAILSLYTMQSVMNSHNCEFNLNQFRRLPSTIQAHLVGSSFERPKTQAHLFAFDLKAENAKMAEDQHLVEYLQVMRAQSGDPDAFARLFERYNARLLYYVRRLVGPGSDAEDVLQEVWLTVVRKVNSLQNPSSFRTWIYRIAHNKSMTRLRKQTPEVPLDEVKELVDEGEEDNSIYQQYDAEAIRSGLDRLSPNHRDVLTLRFMEDLSYEEIAEIIACSVGTVRSRLHYAKKILESELIKPRADGQKT